jgi:anti-anti-sigma factor
MHETSPVRDDIEVIRLQGRIDSITCREIDSIFRSAVIAGKRVIVADMTGVNYVSSAGLRVFLSFQKELKKAGGEICFLGTPPSVFSIFEISGFVSIFRFFASTDALSILCAPKAEVRTGETVFEGGTLTFMTTGNPGSALSIIGTEDKLPSADYTRSDVRSVQASKIDFAAGFAALGNDYENFREYFGECAVIDGNIFVYPAMPRSAVDFIIHSSGERDTIYHFLYGFSFPRNFSQFVSFVPSGNHVTLDDLLARITAGANSPVIGITGICESMGLFGMRLKKVPLRENRAASPIDIFSPENFSQWIDYSVEAEDVYNLVVLTGIAVLDWASAPGSLAGILPSTGLFHVHGIIFDKKPFNRMIDNFPNELKRITTGLEPQRVLHLLGKTRVGHGLFGIVELNG